MHYSFFTHQYPSMNSNGGAELSFSFITELKKKNYKISLFIIAVDEYYEKSILNKKKLEEICDYLYIIRCNRKITLFKKILQNPVNLFYPSKNLLLPAFDLTTNIHEKLSELNPDRIIVYDWWSSAAVYSYKKPKAIIVGDLLHFPVYANILKQKKEFNFFSFFKNFKLFISAIWIFFHFIKLQKELLKYSDTCGSFGKYDADWLNKRCSLKSKYYKTPYKDIATKNFLNFNKRNNLNNKVYKIATALGRLNATATSSGLYFLKNKILREFDKIIGRDNFQIHIFGDGFLNENIKTLANEKNIFIRGFVDDINSELLSSDVFLLATDVFLGYRCRIINGLCRGLPMVLSTYDTINQPELKDGYNCLVGNNENEIAKKTFQILKDKALRLRIMKNARETYLKHFLPEIAVSKILSEFKKNEKI